jgi:hypothetical protein
MIAAHLTIAVGEVRQSAVVGTFWSRSSFQDFSTLIQGFDVLVVKRFRAVSEPNESRIRAKF